MQTLDNPQITNQEAFDTTIHRRKTRGVKVGNITIGGGHPVVVQSMINEDTLDMAFSVHPRLVTTNCNHSLRPDNKCCQYYCISIL